MVWGYASRIADDKEVQIRIQLLSVSHASLGTCRHTRKIVARCVLFPHLAADGVEPSPRVEAGSALETLEVSTGKSQS